MLVQQKEKNEEKEKNEVKENTYSLNVLVHAWKYGPAKDKYVVF